MLKHGSHNIPINQNLNTKQGKHIQISENGELLKGHPASIGGGDKIEKQNSNKNVEKQKKLLNETENSGNIKAQEILKKRIDDGELTVTLNPVLQKNHSKNTHITGKSYFTIEDNEVQDIVTMEKINLEMN